MDRKIIQTIKNKNVDLTEEQVLERLLDRYRWPYKYPWGQPSIEAILEDGTKHQRFFSRDGYLDSEACIKCYEDGYTLIISNIGGFNKDTWTINQLLNNYYKINVNCNFYFGNGKKSVSFKKHSHEYPVIVKNVYGDSTWIIDEKEVILRNQDVVYFDEGINHEVIKINQPKLSITCNMEK